MNKTPFESLDLNLIKVFFILYEELNTHKAAERLHMSQPAVSRTLQKLRDAFNDPIFVKTRHGLSATDKAHFLAQRLPNTWQELADIINHVDEFEFKKLTGKLCVTIHPALIGLISDKLFLALHQTAPQVELVVSVWNSATEQDLLLGKQDFAITMMEPDFSKEMSIKTLPSLFARVYLNKQHPLIDKTIDEQAFTQYPLAVLHVPGWNENITYVEKYLKRRGLSPTIAYRNPHPSSVLSVVAQTQLMHAVGTQYHGISTEKVTSKVIHIDGKPVELNSYFCHHYRHRNKPLFQWLYNSINQIITEQNKAERSR
ncbi:LysR family transcriptional regulator [Shewanella electrodiphila]|uniref:LysR family transcriptional regulator n=1 Tax=Shewanella electrodiphila TaxID=934143 RepID=A0ABT0KKU8_9GAMM|nr:LysR family transcriptional regulator [Shewanella electrodiphila]MCL1044463.1 LysR family transcriptional regulator [Shewanella electrodiphila]